MSSADFDAVRSLLNADKNIIFRKLYFKFRSGAGYETDWTEVSQKYIISYGQISLKTDTIKLNQLNQSQFNIKLDNSSGYFDDPTKAVSIFYGKRARYQTLVKVEIGYTYKGADYSHYFVGFIGENIQEVIEARNIIFAVEPIESLFKQHYVNDIPGIFPATTTAETEAFTMIEKIRDATDGSGNPLFSHMIPVEKWKIDRSYIRYFGYHMNTATNEGKTIKAFLDNLSMSDTFSWGIGRDLWFNYLAEPIEEYYNQINSSESTYCIFHNTFQTVSASVFKSVIGPDVSASTYTIGAVKFGNGARLSNTAPAGFTTTLTNFDPNKFTIEGWVKIRFKTDNGGQATGLSFSGGEAMFWESGTHPITGASLWGTDANWRLGWGTNAESGKRLWARQQTYDLSAGGFAYYLTCTTYNTTSMDWASSTVHFLAFVHDSHGIDGSNDLIRIYANDSATGDITLVGRETAGGAWGRMSAQIYEGTTSVYLGGRSDMFIDNVKIHNFAKVDFADSFFEYNYAKKETLNIRGLADNPDLSAVMLGEKGTILSNIKNVYNYIEINHSLWATSTGEATYIKNDSGWTKGNSTSSDLYGERKYEIENKFLYSETAEIVANNIFDNFSKIQKVFKVDGKINPFFDVLEKYPVTYQTPYVVLADPFTNGFSNGFGRSGRQIDFVNKEFQIIKAQHNLDKLESKFTLREV